MKTLLHWKRGAFSNTYEIFNGENLIGKLKDTTFGNTSDGMIHQKGFRFKTKGLFVTNYYRQIGIAIFVAIFIPIWASAIN